MTWKPIVGRKFDSDEFRDYVNSLILPGMFTPQFIVLHNTQIPNLAQWHDVSMEKRINGLVSWYRDECEWSAGPHLFVADDGIWVFTPLTSAGVHSPSWNKVAWGVELVGDYDNEPLGDDVRIYGMDALDILHRAMKWTMPQLRLHRDDPLTTHRGCPGRNIVREEWEAGVQTLLDLDK